MTPCIHDPKGILPSRPCGPFCHGTIEPKDVQTTDTPANSMQVAGDHYVTKAVQPWDAMQAWMTPEQFVGFLRGNAIKYLARCDDKGGVDDLKKARHYIDKLIEVSVKA